MEKQRSLYRLVLIVYDHALLQVQMMHHYGVEKEFAPLSLELSIFLDHCLHVKFMNEIPYCLLVMS